MKHTLLRAILAVIAVAFFALGFGQISTLNIGDGIGGNIPPLRPGYTTDDLTQTRLALSYLQRGSVARTSAIFWEIFWTPDPNAGNYRGIDQYITECNSKMVVPLILLSPTPYPASPWYSGTGFSDWWLPSRSVWSDIMKCTDALIKHIQTLKSNRQVMYQLMNEPAGRMINPYLNEKPGGSNATVFGEWTPAIHEFMFDLVGVLQANNVSKPLIVAPAISCVGENNKREATEWLSSLPPVEFDWLSACGVRAFHMRFSAGWATDPNTRLSEVTRGFTNCADYLAFCISQRPSLKDQSVMLTEMYVTPGDCGTFIGDNLDPYRKIALDLVAKYRWTPVVWGLRPYEADVPGNPWLFYGGWGDYLIRRRG